MTYDDVHRTRSKCEIFDQLYINNTNLKDYFYDVCTCSLCDITIQAEDAGGGNIDRTVGSLLYTIAAKLKAQIAGHRRLLTQYVAEKKITTDPQLAGKTGG